MIRRSRLALLLVLGMLSAVLPIGSITPAFAVGEGVVINEVDADQVSTDSAEFIELYDGGTGNTDLTGLSIVLYNGSDDASYLAFDLDGHSTDGDGYFVLCGNAGNVANCDLDVSPNTNLIQNGADAVALVVGDASAYPNDTPVSTTGLIDAIVYDTNDGDDAGLLVLLNSGQPQVNEAGGGSSTAHSNQRCPNGTGGERNTDTYLQGPPSPGAASNCPVPPPDFGVCFDGLATLIHTIQGSDVGLSPEVGEVHVIEGVVVGDFQGSSNLSGFFVQEEDSDVDGDELSSEGIFVFDASFGVDVDAGDVVRVRGTVTEFFNQTQIGGVDAVEVCDTGLTVTASQITLPREPGADYEYVEGMSVFFPQTLVASDNFTWGRFGEVGLSVNHALENPTNVVLPGNPANNRNDRNDRSRILLDDGRGSQNPEPPAYVGDGGTLRVGDTLANLTGVISYAFGRYRIQPTGDVTFTRANARPVVVPDVGGTLTVAAFNVLNYFTTLDDSGPICGPDASQGCRGADSAFEFVRQEAKLVSAITEMDADVVGIIEVENSADNGPINDLVAALNAVSGAATYTAIQTGAIGTDAIRVGIIYQPSSVTPVGDFAVLDQSVDSRFNDDKNRPVLAQTFEDNNGERFTIAVNHLKSKGSSCSSIGDPNTGDQQGNCNLTRTAAAEALADWLIDDPTGSGDGDFLIIGDLNSYAHEDPIVALTDAGYTDLVRRYGGPHEYSFVFFGEAGYLDHALANKSMRKQVSGTAVWHINADEPSALDYNNFNQASLYTDGPWRSSDHDPVIVGLDLTSKGR